MNIDNEIKELTHLVSTQFDDSSYYLHKEYEELQKLVLTTHMNMERGMETMISVHFSVQFRPTTHKQLRMVSLELRRLLLNVGYKEKLAYIENKTYTDGQLIKALKKLNTYRNEFAHVDTYKLQAKYDMKAKDGKQNVRNLLRNLRRVNELINSWFMKSKVFLEHNKIMEMIPEE